MTLSLIADIAVAALLVVAIVYAVRLNRQLVAMRQGKNELEAIAVSFEKSMGRAGDSFARLKTSTQQLQEAIRKAETLRDDMTFLLERGTATADRLEGVVRTARHGKDAGTGAATGAGLAADDSDEARAELVADRALRAGGRVVPGPGRGRLRAAEGAPAKPAASAAPEARSEAERDLLRAIRAAR